MRIMLLESRGDRWLLLVAGNEFREPEITPTNNHPHQGIDA